MQLPVSVISEFVKYEVYCIGRPFMFRNAFKVLVDSSFLILWPNRRNYLKIEFDKILGCHPTSSICMATFGLSRNKKRLLMLRINEQ